MELDYETAKTVSTFRVYKYIRNTYTKKWTMDEI